MKKLFIIVSIVFICFTAIPLFAVDLNLGAATWYSWWEMESDGGDQDIDPTILYGPLVSIGLADNWNLSSVFLYGRFIMKHDEDTGVKEEKVNRFDSDTSLNYNLSRYFKVFAGLKAMGYSYPSGYNRSAGPAFGLGITLPLGSNFFILGNLSGMYNYGRTKTMSEEGQETVISNLTAPGVNSTLSLAYYITSASTTVTLGGRYQYFEMHYESERLKDVELFFYGFTLSVVYSF
ncbi:MAG: hypothetical protein ACOCWZ_00915 [Spirochaetota bacterium]